MTARFAGSRSLDERRRRRIAGEHEDGASLTVPAPKGEDIPVTDIAPPATPRRKTRRLPLRLIISPRYWKHIAVGTILFAAGALMLWAGVEAETVGRQAGPDLQQLVTLSNRRLTATFSSFLLLLSAQLAMLICFVRARSHTDFSGRYRIWGWAALVGFLASASVALNLHHIWSRSLAWWLQMEFQKLETLCWLAPAIGCGSVLVRDLLADIRDCRASTTAFWLTLICWTASCVQILGYGVALPERFAPLATSGVAMLGHYFLFISLMLHARYVIFVSAEPPVLRPPLWKTAVGRLSAWLSKRRATRVTRKLEAQAAAKQLAREKGESKSDTKKPAQQKPAAVVEKPREKLRDESDKTTTSGKSAVSAETKSAVESTSGKKFRFDQPHELEDVAGLSKRERRRLRKQKQAQKKSQSASN